MFYKKYNAIFARCSFHTVKFISLCKLIKLLPANFLAGNFFIVNLQVLRPYKLLIILF